MAAGMFQPIGGQFIKSLVQFNVTLAMFVLCQFAFPFQLA